MLLKKKKQKKHTSLREITMKYISFILKKRSAEQFLQRITRMNNLSVVADKSEDDRNKSSGGILGDSLKGVLREGQWIKVSCMPSNGGVENA